MRIGGLQKFSLIDYPNKVACIIFAQGCNFRCGYCHNPQLVIPEQFCPVIPEEDVFKFLKSRSSYLKGVVVSGGEPTIQNDLPDFLKKIKHLGYSVKLDTNGSRPEILCALIADKLIDYIAMDIKAPLDKYEEVVGASMDVERIKDSINLILESGIDYQFRTTVMKSFCSFQDLCAIREMTQKTPRFLLQRGRLDEKILNKSLLSCQQYSDEEFNKLKQDFENK